MILLVEDESVTRTHLHAILSKAGYAVLEAEDGEKGLELFRDASPEAVLLDIMLPGIDGFETCRRLRALSSSVAILMLSVRREGADKIQALELGADDYLVKPCDPGELVARIHAVLRRTAGLSTARNELHSGVFRVESNPPRCFKGGAPIDLTPKETALLITFLRNRGRTLRREELQQQLWGRGHHGSPKALDVYIQRLRKKIEDNPSHPTYLKTVWGSGYLWREDPS